MAHASCASKPPSPPCSPACSETNLKPELARVGAGLPAMQTPRYLRQIRLMPSQRCGDPTSQLPHWICVVTVFCMPADNL
ncbi:hypothetical protein F7R12_29680 [Pseudomonas tolaasii]|nr:hypothetical protein F7R12_29680 [Pseudomonas tolaasii]